MRDSTDASDQKPTAVVSISGGKDSNATAILAILTLGRENVRLVHADTGHEHPVTERYVREYLPEALGLPVEIVRADFAADFARKRAYIAAHWEEDGVPAERVAEALRLLVPTGIPFLDLCMMKGRFPSKMAQFCTEELKRYPLDRYSVGLAKSGLAIENWQGIRRDESRNRRNSQAAEWSDYGWSIRWPEEVERVNSWERLVGACSKKGFSTLLHKKDWSGSVATSEAIFAAERIEQQILWARTTRGGRQFDLERSMPAAECSSVYGLCE